MMQTGMIQMTKTLTVRHASDNDVLKNYLTMMYVTTDAIQYNKIGTIVSVCLLTVYNEITMDVFNV